MTDSENDRRNGAGIGDLRDAGDVFDVAVVGAGIAGMATALGFARAGLRVALIGPTGAAHIPTDAAPYDPRIYALAPASIDLLTRLRVWAQVDAARIQEVATMSVYGDAGGHLTFDAWTAAVPTLAVIVEESQLLRVLGAACGYATLERYSAGFERMQISADATRLFLADGRVLHARAVIGADGAQSAVRAAAGIDARTRPYGQAAVVANFLAQQPHDGRARQWFTRQGVIALLPLPGQLVSLVWSAPEALAAELVKLAPGALAQRVVDRVGGQPGWLRPAGPVSSFALRRVDVARLVQPRVALVGDAAHVIHPLAGQGLNLGLQDVSELLRAVAGAAGGRGAEGGNVDPGALQHLRRYERMRAEAIVSMRFATDTLARLFDVDNPLARRLRNLGMSLVDSVGPVKRALVRQALG